jgi:hypothetical protein
MVQVKRRIQKWKRRKISLRTKIYLTIVGVLALTGATYAANPVFFTQFIQATGVAVSPLDMYATPWCDQSFYGFDCIGNASVLGMIPLGDSSCSEKYLAIAPRQSIAAGFTATDVFITEGQNIYKFSGGTITFFAQVGCSFPGHTDDHTSITFDKVSTFGNKMIVACTAGFVFTIDGNGNVTLIADTGGTFIEGPAIPPPSFGPLGGQILVADEVNGQVHAIDSNGNVTHNAFNWTAPLGKGAENVNVIPSNPCTFGCMGGTFFQAIEDQGFILDYAPIDFAGLGGNVIVTSEAVPPDTAMGTVLVTFNAVTQTYDTTLFDGTFNFSIGEGATFVDCDAVTPTPTPTPTASPSPIATATFTPTPTATATAHSHCYGHSHSRSYGYANTDAYSNVTTGLCI